jgi:HlyD family secretion protein
LKQYQLTAEQSKDDAQGRVGQAQADITAAEADRAQQEASLMIPLFDKDAYTKLVQTGAVSERQGELPVAAYPENAISVAHPCRSSRCSETLY